jgi:hypothetical protein
VTGYPRIRCKEGQVLLTCRCTCCALTQNLTRHLRRLVAITLHTQTHICSYMLLDGTPNTHRVSETCMCLGPLASAVMNGRLISVVAVLLSSHLAFSAASRRRCTASLSLDRSMPCSYSSRCKSVTCQDNNVIRSQGDE